MRRGQRRATKTKQRGRESKGKDENGGKNRKSKLRAVKDKKEGKKASQQAAEVAVGPKAKSDRNSSLLPAGVADESVEASRAVRVVGHEVGWSRARGGGHAVQS